MRYTLAVLAAMGCTTPAAPRDRARSTPPIPEVAAKINYVLRELVLYEEAYFADSVDYTSDLSRLRGWYDRPSKGYAREWVYGRLDPRRIAVTMLTADFRGWSAIGRDEWGLLECRIYVGTGRHVLAGMPEGEPRCELQD